MKGIFLSKYYECVLSFVKYPLNNCVREMAGKMESVRNGFLIPMEPTSKNGSNVGYWNISGTVNKLAWCDVIKPF